MVYCLCRRQCVSAVWNKTATILMKHNYGSRHYTGMGIENLMEKISLWTSQTTFPVSIPTYLPTYLQNSIHPSINHVKTAHSRSTSRWRRAKCPKCRIWTFGFIVHPEYTGSLIPAPPSTPPTLSVGNQLPMDCQKSVILEWDVRLVKVLARQSSPDPITLWGQDLVVNELLS